MSQFFIVVFVLIAAYKIWLPTTQELAAPAPSRRAYLFCILLIGAWMGIYFPALFSGAYMPDEGWFLYVAAVERPAPEWLGPVRDYIFHQNSFGYGSTWWGIYSLIVDVMRHVMPPANPGQVFSMDSIALGLHDAVAAGNGYLLASMLIMRALAVSVVAVFALLLSRRALIQPMAALGVLLLFSTPMMYWSGKMASPEMVGVFLLLIAVLKYIDGRDRRWFLLAGFACGTKLTCAPVAVVFALFAILPGDRRQLVRRFLEITAYSVAGALLSNLYLLYNPAYFVHTLKLFSGMFNPAPWELSFKYGPLPFWEGGTYGNLGYWFGSLAVFGAALLVAVLTNAWLGIGVICAAVVMFLFMLTQPLHNWYWFPVIGATTIPICYAKEHRRIVIPALVGILVAANLYFSAPGIKAEIGYRETKVAQLDSYKETKKCFDQATRQGGITEIFDVGVIGHILPSVVDAKTTLYRTAFDALPAQQDIGARTDRLAVIGAMAQATPHIAEFMDKAQASSASVQTCGRTVLVRF